MTKENQKRWRLAWTAAFSFHAALCLLLAAAGPLFFPAPAPPVIEVDLLTGSEGGGRGGAGSALPSPAGAPPLLAVRGQGLEETQTDESADYASRAAVSADEENGREAGAGDGAGPGEGSGTGGGEGSKTGSGGNGDASGGNAVEAPRILSAPDPVYPESARRRGVEGTVTAGLLIDADGGVTEVWVESSSGDGALDEAALAAVRRWRFAPAHQNGVPVSARSRVPVVFALHG